MFSKTNYYNLVFLLFCRKDELQMFFSTTKETYPSQKDDYLQVGKIERSKVKSTE
jgi:hypothetical protein